MTQYFSNPTHLVRTAFLILCSLVLAMTSIPFAGAMTQEEYEQAIRDSVYYDVNDYTFCDVKSDSISLVGNDNIEKAYNYFKSKGVLSAEQVSGIVGNFIAESNVNPTIMNGIGAYGIAQWLDARKSALQSRANYNTLGVQLDFTWYELNGPEKAALTDLLKQTTPESAALSFEDKYERSGGALLERRKNAARSVFEQFGAGGSTGTSSSSCVGTGPGQDTQYIDGFTIYSQYDPLWKDLKYGTSTVGASGCGPAAMAMIITALTGRQITPTQTTNYANTKNLYVAGEGSSWTIAPVLASYWGLKSAKISADVTAITQALRSGRLVIGAGRGGLPFTESGHYIVIRGVTDTGKFMVGDSAHKETNSQEWDPADLVSKMAAGSMYSIYK
jgi:hypothetical protein